MAASLVRRLFSDRVFSGRQKQIAFERFARQADPMRMIDDMEAAIAAAAALSNDLARVPAGSNID